MKPRIVITVMAGINQRSLATRASAGALVDFTAQAENPLGSDRPFTLAPADAISSGDGGAGADEQVVNAAANRIGMRQRF